MSSWSLSGVISCESDFSYSAIRIGEGAGAESISGLTFLSYQVIACPYLLAHSARGLEVLHERLLALDPCVGQLAHLL